MSADETGSNTSTVDPSPLDFGVLDVTLRRRPPLLSTLPLSVGLALATPILWAAASVFAGGSGKGWFNPTHVLPILAAIGAILSWLWLGVHGLLVRGARIRGVSKALKEWDGDLSPPRLADLVSRALAYCGCTRHSIRPFNYSHAYQLWEALDAAGGDYPVVWVVDAARMDEVELFLRSENAYPMKPLAIGPRGLTRGALMPIGAFLGMVVTMLAPLWIPGISYQPGRGWPVVGAIIGCAIGWLIIKLMGSSGFMVVRQSGMTMFGKTRRDGHMPLCSPTMPRDVLWIVSPTYQHGLLGPLRDSSSVKLNIRTKRYPQFEIEIDDGDVHVFGDDDR